MERKVVLITGASRGIGAATAFYFAKKNYDVVIHYYKGFEDALRIQKQIEEQYSVNTMVVGADVSVETEVKELVEQVYQTMKRINVLVNNAGISIDTLFYDKTVEQFKRTIDVNLIGTFLMSKYVGMNMFEKGGSIINLSSTNGIDQGFPMCLDYDASKAGIISLTKNLAIQYAPKIRVNAVAPGWVATENELKELDEDYIKLEQDKILLHRFGTPEEIAAAIYFLASEEAGFINGTVLRIDGGQ